MNDIYFKMLIDYNRTYKAVDEMYANYARSCGLSEADFWILYALAEKGEKKTQKDLCEWWSVSKQTINSALKRFEKEGVVVLSSSADNKKSKYITLTDKGTDLVEKIIHPLMAAEMDVFEIMGEENTQEYLRLNKMYSAILEKAIRDVSVIGIESK